VTHGIDLSTLSHAQKDELIQSLLPLVGQLEPALARIADLERRLAVLERPPKNPDNSSLPRSKGPKSDRPTSDKPPRKSRRGFGRALEPNPDRTVDARLDSCPHCSAAFPAERQTPQQVYDRIELPPIKPDVTRGRLFGGRCACCGKRATAAAPSALEPGSPFGQSIAAVAVYLHYAHVIGLERLAALMGELFALTISEGAINNMLARARKPSQAAAAVICQTVTTSAVACSDETSARVSGKTWWEWVFVDTLAVLHIIRPSRGKVVVADLFGAIPPLAWVSDMLGSQRGHGVEWQVCLTHLLRDARYAVECGDIAFSAAFKRAAAARNRHWATARHTERYNAEAISCRFGSPARSDHGRCPDWRAGAQVTQTHRRQPQPLVRVYHQPQRALHQQRVRAEPSSQRDLSQGHQRLPPRIGCRNLRRLPFRRQHRNSQPIRRARDTPLRTRHRTAIRTGVSNYLLGSIVPCRTPPPSTRPRLSRTTYRLQVTNRLDEAPSRPQDKS
jgi:transposase